MGELYISNLEPATNELKGKYIWHRIKSLKMENVMTSRVTEL